MQDLLQNVLAAWDEAERIAAEAVLENFRTRKR
jgi:hypothetical protein